MQSLLLFSAKLRDCNMPGFPILTISQSLLKCMSVELVMLSRAWWLILCHPLLLLPSIFPSIKSSPVSQLFASGGQSIRVSASASVFSMNIQGWFPLGLTGLIILQSRRLSRVFFSTTIWKHQFFSAQPSLWYNSHTHTWLLERPSFHDADFCQKSDVSVF